MNDDDDETDDYHHSPQSYQQSANCTRELGKTCIKLVKMHNKTGKRNIRDLANRILIW